MHYELRQLQDAYRTRGLRGAAERARGALQARVYLEEEHVILVKRLGDASGGAAAPAGMEVRRSLPEDTPALLGFCRAHFDASGIRHVRNFLENGYRAFLGIEGGEIRAMFWAIDAADDPRHPDLLLHEIVLGPREAYGFSLFAAPEHRGAGMASGFLTAVCARLAEEGYDRLWGWVLADNRPAKWLFMTTGFVATSRMTIRTFGSLLATNEDDVLIRNFGLRSRHAFGYRPVRVEARRTVTPV